MTRSNWSLKGIQILHYVRENTGVILIFHQMDQRKSESAFVFGFPGSTIQMPWVWNVLTCTEDKKGKSPLESKKQKHHEYMNVLPCFAYHSQDMMYVTLGFHGFWILTCRSKNLYPSFHILTVERLEHGKPCGEKEDSRFAKVNLQFSGSSFSMSGLQAMN